jgi:hypothetical protein
MMMHGKKPVDTIFVHCSATRPDWMAEMTLDEKIKEITKWHRGRGFGDIGYHWIIDRNGQIAKGRPEETTGAHVAGYNTGSIGICLIGGHGSNESDPFSKNYTLEQETALRKLIEEIKGRTKIKSIHGHNEVAAKACPGFSVARWLANKAPQPKLTESRTMQASAVQIASGAGAAATAIGALEGYAQLAVIVLGFVVMLAAAWIMRERILKWVKETGA